MQRNDSTRKQIVASLVAGLALLTIFIVLLVIVLSPLEQRQPAVQPPAVTVSQPQPAIETVPGVLSYINIYREERGLPALKLNAQLNSSAQAKSDDLVAVGYWAHNRDGRTPWTFITESGYIYQRAGENLAKCFDDPEALVQAWIDSPTHREVLTGDYKDVGFGIRHNAHDNCDYITGHFASPIIDVTELPVTGVAR